MHRNMNLGEPRQAIKWDVTVSRNPDWVSMKGETPPSARAVPSSVCTLLGTLHGRIYMNSSMLDYELYVLL